MCGITGIVGNDIKRYRKALPLMVKAIGHRGPDGQGTHFFKNCALGHVRLSIVDLVTGDQPMVDVNAAITFNGEIYGYKDIKKKLTKYSFRTTSDTEVVLALYDKYGTDFVKHLPGMFAFALWDDKQNELVCARDRFGEKPFYYAFGPSGELIFASEIKGVLASGLVKPIIDPKVVSYYLKYLYVRPNQTIYQNIYCLPPAHILKYKEGRIKVERYWSPIIPTSKIELSEAADKFESLFSRSVANQLTADVPVGVLLSGGLDSSSVLATAVKYKSKIKTFSFGFEGGRNELPYARKVSQLFNTEHHEFLEKDVKISHLILTMAKVYDEPFADSSNIPTYLISKLARKYVKVVLTGDGGDELLGGYSSWYRPLVSMQDKNPFFWARLALFQALSWGYVISRSQYPLEKRYKLEGLKYKVQYGNIGQAHSEQLSHFSDQDLESLGLPSVNRFKTNDFNRLLQEDVQSYMAGDILVKTDRASMAWGLELRAPFLDVDLASFCLSLPLNLKVTGKSDKILLREVMKNRLPDDILHRQKRGFGAPIEKWLKDSDVIELRKEFLEDPNQNIFALLPYNKVQPLVKKNDFHCWSLLNLAIWMSVNKYDIRS